MSQKQTNKLINKQRKQRKNANKCHQNSKKTQIYIWFTSASVMMGGQIEKVNQGLTNKNK